MQQNVSRQNTSYNKITSPEWDQYKQNLPNKRWNPRHAPMCTCTPLSFLGVLRHMPCPIPVNWQHQCPLNKVNKCQLLQHLRAPDKPSARLPARDHAHLHTQPELCIVFQVDVCAWHQAHLFSNNEAVNIYIFTFSNPKAPSAVSSRGLQWER